ncbi:hypothetical protein D9615_001953 [Tricholomella constricta]|uniref:HNH nuclease domain-containing protein n=1 Tax=Tricholomella constricta TaxID=117010 RepID=A0A8H5HNK2_9AGAR|nr:hypothetical protein D9615_001953 [Tricholomella constricta]
MPQSSSDGSSSVSDSQKALITSRDGSLCVLCGFGTIDITHVVARNSDDHRTVEWIRQVAPSLSNFRKDDASNLICLCPNHHRQFESGQFVLVPSPQVRKVMLDHELSDFAMREDLVTRGESDPGRTFPPLINEFDYIPLRGGPLCIQIHNPTPYDSSLFIFDNLDNRLCPLLHFGASHIALMAEALPHLSNVARLRGQKSEAALPEISNLLELYHRQPNRSDPTPVITVPDYEAFCADIERSNAHPSAPVLPAVPSSTPPMNPLPTQTNRGFMSNITASSSVETRGSPPGPTPIESDVSSQTEHTSDDLYVGEDVQLMEYAEEQPVTWEELQNRPRLFGGDEVGPWRFASADDICRSMTRV